MNATLETPAPAARPKTVKPAKWKILLVDDDPAIRQILLRLLEEENYLVLTAANGGSMRATYVGPRESTGTQGKLDATLERMDVEALVKAAGFTLQQKFIAGEVSGEAHLTGLPATPRGQVSR